MSALARLGRWRRANRISVVETRNIPFSAGVSGFRFHGCRASKGDFECRGPPTSLGDFHDAEFFISPPDLAWTIRHTHEDLAPGGP